MKPSSDINLSPLAEDPQPLPDPEGLPVYHNGTTKRSRRKPRPDPLDRLDHMSDADLLAEAGIEQIFSTSETAEYFDRTNQWLYWGLREKIFVDQEGNPIVPERIGDPERGKRRFTMDIIKEILLSSHRRGNIDRDELTVILRRIALTELGVEWREREGWKLVELGKKRTRWVHPDKAFYDRRTKKWAIRPEVVKVED